MRAQTFEKGVADSTQIITLYKEGGTDCGVSHVCGASLGAGGFSLWPGSSG